MCLQSGDQIEILTSRKQKPKEDWLNMVATASARSKIRAALRANRQKLAAEGKRSCASSSKSWHRLSSKPTLRSSHRLEVRQSPAELFVRLADGRLYSMNSRRRAARRPLAFHSKDRTCARSLSAEAPKIKSPKKDDAWYWASTSNRSTTPWRPAVVPFQVTTCLALSRFQGASKFTALPVRIRPSCCPSTAIACSRHGGRERRRRAQSVHRYGDHFVFRSG